MTTIVTEFGQFRYNCLHMGMCTSGDILYAKVYKMLSDIEGTKTCIDDILASIKDRLSKKIEKRRIIFHRLSAAGLKFNVGNNG